MPRPKSAKPLYTRGPYELHRRAGRENLEIVWYDASARRQRSRSAGSGDVREAKEALDRLYLQRERGQSVCPTCNRPWEDQRSFLLVQSMMDYSASRQSRPSHPAILASLGHVHAYLEATGQTAIGCEGVDREWIEAFWEWAMDVPVISPAGHERERAPATVNNSVLYLAAAVNFSHRRRDTLYPAAFKAKKPEDVNRTPTYRVGVGGLARMFGYAMKYPEKRRALLNFLRASVVTLIRPEHAHHLDVSPAAGMWHSDGPSFNLLPRGQEQTKKRRPIVPVARQAVDWLNGETGQLVPINSITSSWTRMQAALGLPGEGQAGPKLVRRSMASLVRSRIDRRDQPELEMFMGHRASSATTDLYAPFDPEYLSRARAAIESIIDDIEALVPGAFSRANTAEGARVVSLAGRFSQ